MTLRTGPSQEMARSGRRIAIGFARVLDRGDDTYVQLTGSIFRFRSVGTPIDQFGVKPHYPRSIAP